MCRPCRRARRAQSDKPHGDAVEDEDSSDREPLDACHPSTSPLQDPWTGRCRGPGQYDDESTRSSPDGNPSTAGDAFPTRRTSIAAYSRRSTPTGMSRSAAPSRWSPQVAGPAWASRAVKAHVGSGATSLTAGLGRLATAAGGRPAFRRRQHRGGYPGVQDSGQPSAEWPRSQVAPPTLSKWRFRTTRRARGVMVLVTDRT